MATLRKIAVLLHEDDPYPRFRGSVIWLLCDVWRERNIEVEVVKGVDRNVDADILFSHLNLSQVPQRYEEFRQRHRLVVNGGVRDITKQAISENLILRRDGYVGPVIVKTNRNYGGLPDFALKQRAIERRPLGSLLAALNGTINRRSRRFLRLTRTLDVDRYLVFPTTASVPRGVFKNRNLVVEKFLPERDGDLYCLRAYVFLGDRYVNTLNKSREPIVKSHSLVSREEVPVPDEIVEVRRRLSFDYGKLDYVISDGRVVLLDANTTPGGPPTLGGATAAAMARRVAEGIWSLWKPAD